MERLIKTFRRYPDHVVLPVFDGQTGHPPILPARLIPKIRQMDPKAGLRSLLFSPGQRQKEVLVHDRGILMDADTKEDFLALTDKYAACDIPDEQECRSIIHAHAKTKTPLVRHLDLVARTATHLARGTGLDLNLIRAGALLHDIKRMEADHAQAAGDYLTDLGFPRVASIVLAHTDFGVWENRQAPLTEKEIVFLADKICNGSHLELDYKRRFDEKKRRFPQAAKRIDRRYETARYIQSRLEKFRERPLHQCL